MNEPGTLPAVIADRDARAVMLLSLDVTRPFLSGIGVNVRGAFAWTETTRDFVRAYRQGFDARPPSQHTPPPLPDLGSFTRDQLGPVAADVLRWWLQNVYASAPSDHSEYRSSDAVFRHARRRPEVWRELELPPMTADAVIRRYDVAVSTKHFADLWDRAASEPFTDWDLHMYAVDAWNDDLDVPNGPESRLFLIFSDYQSRSFWDALQRELSADERGRLQRAAQRVVDATPNLQSVGRLPPLVTLRIAWP